MNTNNIPDIPIAGGKGRVRKTQKQNYGRGTFVLQETKRKTVPGATLEGIKWIICHFWVERSTEMFSVFHSISQICTTQSTNYFLLISMKPDNPLKLVIAIE